MLHTLTEEAPEDYNEISFVCLRPDGCLVGAGIFLAFIGIKIVGLYKKYCWDMITIMVILISMATAIYFGNWIKTVLPINLLFFLLFVQLVYVGIRWYVKGWRENRGYV